MSSHEDVSVEAPRGLFELRRAAGMTPGAVSTGKATAVALLLGVQWLLPEAQAQPDRAVSLTSTQRSDLLRVTCDRFGTSARAEVQASLVRTPTRGLAATVLCPSLPRFRSFPAFTRFFCDSTGGKWTCPEREDVVEVTVNTRQIRVAYRKGVMSPALAIDITRYIGEQHPLTFNGYNLREMMILGECRVSPGGPAALPDSRNYILFCSPNQLTVGRQCVATRCRMFPVAYTPQVPE